MQGVELYHHNCRLSTSRGNNSLFKHSVKAYEPLHSFYYGEKFLSPEKYILRALHRESFHLLKNIYLQGSNSITGADRFDLSVLCFILRVTELLWKVKISLL